MKPSLFVVVYGALLTWTSGCTSIESTMVTRDETNQTWEQHRCLKGIPITLKVPTHLKVYVFHKHYLEVVGANHVVPVEVDVVVRDFAHEFMYTDKIFTVDFKRPLAGSSNLLMEMTDEQYIDKLQHDVTDKSIEKIGGLITAISPQSKAGSMSAAGLADDRRIKEVRSLVATGIFEIESPDFEAQVMQFINCHVNQSHDAWVVPDGVKSFNRVGIPSDKNENLEVPYPSVPLCPGQCGNIVPTVGPALGVAPNEIIITDALQGADE